MAGAGRDSRWLSKPVWTAVCGPPATRRGHSRARLRYGSDLTERRLLEPLLPAPKHTGRRRAWLMREVIKAIFYGLERAVRGGCRPPASRRLPFVERAFADCGYAADRVATAPRIVVEIVRKPAGQAGFAVHPRRWVMERFFAWIGRDRRLAKDFEATVASAQPFLYAASIMLLARRIGRSA